MAAQQNNVSIAKDAGLIEACEALAVSYAGTILATEAPFQNGGGTNYDAYNKRMALAKEAIDTKGKTLGTRMAVLVATIDASIIANQQANFDYLFNNNYCEQPVAQSGGLTGVVPNTSGTQLWNILAGVNQLDLV